MSELQALKLTETTINYLREIAPRVYILSYKKTHQFVPGQVVGISLSDKEDPRLYSIASGSGENEIRILFNVVPEGSLTKKLFRLQEGDHIYVSEPFGTFYGKSGPAYWIAAGTGIAPFLSMYHSGLGKNKKLIHGGRTLDSFYFEKDLKEFFGENYVRCCSREKGKDVYEGRLTKYLSELDELPSDHDYYLCGSSEMVSETRDILIEKGVPFNNIIAEIYF